jgi:hypothetical protein
LKVTGEILDTVINTKTGLVLEGTIDGLTEIPKDATLKISFNTQEFEDYPEIIPENFRFFSSDAKLKSGTFKGTKYPNPETLEVKEIDDKGQFIILNYNAPSSKMF